jgi:hypothetical protein
METETLQVIDEVIAPRYSREQFVHLRGALLPWFEISFRHSAIFLPSTVLPASFAENFT